MLIYSQYGCVSVFLRSPFLSSIYRGTIDEDPVILLLLEEEKNNCAGNETCTKHREDDNERQISLANRAIVERLEESLYSH